MSLRIWTLSLPALFLLAGPIHAQEDGKSDRLFRSNDILEVTITAPFTSLMRERPLENDMPATLTYVDDAGEIVEFDIGIRTRGRYRHQARVCPFAPIRLNFNKAETKDTLFSKQDKLKLVTHCRDHSDRYQQATLREYLAYRFLNEITHLSFQVRLMRINYVDTEKPDKERIAYGFVIEHRDRLSKRIGLPHIEVKRTRVEQLQGEYTNLSSVFQFYIANTDFSPIAGAPDDFCCHNTNLFGKPGEPIYAIAYDFDMAGMTDTAYATPNPKFRIRTVRQRVYRGRCSNNQHLPASLAQFRAQRENFNAIMESLEPLDKSSRSGMRSLMKSFDKLIDNPKAVERKLVKECV